MRQQGSSIPYTTIGGFMLKYQSSKSSDSYYVFTTIDGSRVSQFDNFNNPGKILNILNRPQIRQIKAFQEGNLT